MPRMDGVEFLKKLMPQYPLPVVVVKAVEMTFMDVAFIDVVELEYPEELQFGNIIYVSFYAPVLGGMILHLPRECKKMIVENIHGSNWEALPPNEIDDCLVEVLNVLAGNFLNQYCGKGTRHSMSFPEIMFDESTIPAKDNYIDYYFDGEGKIFKVSVCIQEQQ